MTSLYDTIPNNALVFEGDHLKNCHCTLAAHFNNHGILPYIPDQMKIPPATMGFPSARDKSQTSISSGSQQKTQENLVKSAKIYIYMYTYIYIHMDSIF